jgi:predicted dehydrogenase
MNILIAGLGSVGRRHLRNLLALGEKDIIFYRTFQATLPDDELVAYPTETDLASALAHKPEAVIIANPTALHMEVAIPAAEAGCHLFMEKPISHSLDGLDRLETILVERNRQALVGFQFRFHPTLQKTASLLKDGMIGRPLSVRAHWGEYLPGFHPWEDYRLSYAARADLGGGVTLTLCHPLDYLRWLLGDVEALWAFASRQSDLELNVEDTAEIGLRFASGATGSLHLDYNQRPSTHLLEIIGTQGTLRWDNASGRLSVYRANAQSLGWEEYNPPERFERNDLFLAEMRHFLAVVRDEEKPVCTLQDGAAALRLVLGAQESANEGKLIHL